jgi:hypothetical protein
VIVKVDGKRVKRVKRKRFKVTISVRRPACGPPHGAGHRRGQRRQPWHQRKALAPLRELRSVRCTRVWCNGCT